MEARSFSAERARTLLVKVKEYKADLAALRTELKKVLRLKPSTEDPDLRCVALSSVDIAGVQTVASKTLQLGFSENPQLVCKSASAWALFRL